MLRKLFLLSLIAVGLLATSASSCSVHDHMCQFQGVGRAVNHTINQNSPTSVVIGSIGNNGVDFDNHVLLPDGNGPYIASALPIFDTGQPYLSQYEQPRRVAPGQYQVDFQNGTAQATHSGDFNGAAAIPNPPGCTIGTGPYCEEIRIIGNIPDQGTPEGFVVRQTNYLYNFHNVANPAIDLITYGAATGQAYFKQNSHLGYEIIDDPNKVGTQYSGLRREFLAGNKATGAEQMYYIGYDNFDAHAAGVVVHYDQTRKVLSSVYDVQFGHQTPGGTSQYSGLQRKDTIARFDRTYDFTQLAFADTGLPALHLNDQETARWNTWSDIYGVKENAGYTDYVAEQARISQEQYERDLAAGCNFSGCSNQTQAPPILRFAATTGQTPIRLQQRIVYDGNPNVTFDRDSYYFFAGEDASFADRAFVKFMNVGTKGIEINNEYKVTTRAIGGAQAVIGGLEVVGGVTGGAACTGATAGVGSPVCVGGATLVVANGADNAQAGLRTLVTGEFTHTIAGDFGGVIAEDVFDATPETAEKVRTLTEIGTGIPAITTSGINLYKNGTNLLRKSPNAVLNSYRKSSGLPIAGSIDDTHTVAYLEHNGTKYFSRNAHGETVTGVNIISSTHAEVGVLAQLQKTNIDVTGQKLLLYVDRTPCKACGQNGGIRTMVRQLGLDELEVIGPEGSIIIKP